MDDLIDHVGDAGGKIAQLIGDVGCNTDPFGQIKARFERLKKFAKAFQQLPLAIVRAMHVLKDANVLKEGLKDVLSPFEKDVKGDFERSSILLSVDISAEANVLSTAKSYGVFLTFDSIHILSLIHI